MKKVVWMAIGAALVASTQAVAGALLELPPNPFEPVPQWECIALGVPVIDADHRERAGEAANPALAAIAVSYAAVPVPQGWTPLAGGGLASTGDGIVSTVVACRSGMRAKDEEPHEEPAPKRSATPRDPDLVDPAFFDEAE